MTKLVKINCSKRWSNGSDFIDLDNWTNASYGEFTKYVRKNYNYMYQREDVKKVRVKVDGEITLEKEGFIDLEISDEKDVIRAIQENSDEIHWYCDYEQDGEIRIESYFIQDRPVYLSGKGLQLEFNFGKE